MKELFKISLLIKFFLFNILLLSVSCNDVVLLERAITNRINVTNIPECDLDNPDQDLCIIFHDSFEREHLGAGDFKWSKFIMDAGRNGDNVDAAIYPKNFLGPVIDGEKALLFTGRAGGSVHEIYLISEPLNLSNYNKVQIQFDYVPLSLEPEISFKYWKTIPESIRIDICNESDFECGIDPTNSSKLKSNKWINPIEDWINKFDFRFGEGLTLKDKGNSKQVPYTIKDWVEVNISYDLKYYSGDKSNFVFRVSVALDEGFIDNKSTNDLEDGIIFDNIYVIAIK